MINHHFIKVNKNQENKSYMTTFSLINEAVNLFEGSVNILFQSKIQSISFSFYNIEGGIINMTKLSNPMTVVALANGMIGGTILVLPVLALHTGYLLIPIISLVMGVTSLYTAWMVVKHLGHYPTVNQGILAHFNARKFYVIFYNVVVMISMIAILILYFNLVVKQVEGLMGLKEGYDIGKKADEERFLPYILAIVLFVLVLLMRKFEFGSALLAYGIISIIGYCIFLIWVYATSPQTLQGSNPPIKRQIPAFDSLFVDFMASLSMAYSIHLFMMPILKSNPNQNNHIAILKISYLIGIGVYTFVAYSCFALVNRNVYGQAQTIIDYFTDMNGNSTWPVYVIEALYSIHLFSAFPQFLIIGKLRIFSIYQSCFDAEVQKHQHVSQLEQAQQSHAIQPITATEIAFYLFFIAFCCMLKVLGMKIALIIEINGAILCFVYVYFIPIILHVKCIYFRDGFNLNSIKNLFTSQQIIGQKLQVGENNPKKKQNIELETGNHRQTYFCPCYQQYLRKTTYYKIFQIIAMILMLILGGFTMVYTMYTVFAQPGQKN